MDKTHRYGVKLKKSSVNSFYRGVAYLIDWYVATMFAGIPIVLIGSIVNHTTSVSQDLSKIPAPYNILVALLAIVFYLGYFVILELYVYKGQTLGMASPSRKMIHDRIANTHIMSVAGTEK